MKDIIKSVLIIIFLVGAGTKIYDELLAKVKFAAIEKLSGKRAFNLQKYTQKMTD